MNRNPTHEPSEESKDTGQNQGNSQDELAVIFNASTDVIFLLEIEADELYRFSSVNRAFLEATGLSKEEIEGKYIGQVIPELSGALVLDKFRQAMCDCQTLEWEETIAYPAGLRTGIVSISPVFNNLNKCTRLVVSVHDISGRKKAEQEKAHVNRLLKERVKELTTLYTTSQILHSETKSVDEVLHEIVAILPPGWQYPEVTEARIVVGKMEYKTDGFGLALDKQSASFSIPDGKNGIIEVAYTDRKPFEVEGPFLAEERKLINMLAEMLNNYFSRKGIMELAIKEKELSESIINSLPGIFYLFDSSGNYLRWNKNHETVTGYSKEEMEAMHPLKFFTEEEKDLLREKIEKVFTDGYAEVEANFVGKNKKGIPYYFNGIRVEYEGKMCIMGVGLDITERVKAEQELRQAEIKFRTLVEKSQVGVYIVQKGKFTYVNPRFAEIFGYNTEELIGKDPVAMVISEEYQDLTRENVRARLEGDVETVHYEVTGKRKDGTPNRVEFYGSRTLYEDQPTIIGTMVDITERKLAEEALQKSEANLHAIFDTTDTIYFLLDNNFLVMSFNHRAFDFVKKELRNELRLYTNLIGYLPEEKRAELYKRMEEVLAGGLVNYESSYLQKGGTFNWYHVRILPITSNKKEIYGMMVAVSDITEKKLLQQKIVHQKVEEQKKITRAILNAQEKERNKIGQELHDNVNQILVGSKMCLGLTPSDIEDRNKFIKRSISLIDDAVNEIRTITREHVTPQRKIDLGGIIQLLVDNLNEQSAIKANFLYEASGLVVKDDLKLNIYRIIQESINNIVKHAGAKNVTVLLRTTEKEINIGVRDDGKGFNYIPNKTKGIGLSNIINRVESYNGKIDIESSLGNGCSISVVLPL